MSISKFVFDSIIKAATKGGATESSARRFADIGVTDFERSSFLDKNVGQMIDRLSKEAIKQSKVSSKKQPPRLAPAAPKKKTKPKEPVKRKITNSARNDFVSQKVKERTYPGGGLWSKKL